MSTGVHCTGCGAVLGDAWCGACAGKAANERAALAEAERDRLRALLPKCSGTWLKGSGGHRVYAHDCGIPGVWDVGGQYVCDTHKNLHGGDTDAWEWWRERDKYEELAGSDGARVVERALMADAERNQWRSMHGQELEMRMEAERLLAGERDEVELKRAALAGVQSDRDATARDNARLRADLKEWQDKLYEVRENYAPVVEAVGRWAVYGRDDADDEHDLLRAYRALNVRENSDACQFTAQDKHCDDYIHDFAAPHCLRFFLLVNRLPATDAMLCRAAGVTPKLFASHEGVRVRVVMASRLGDVGITRRLDAEDGYEKRVLVADLTDFGEKP